MGVGVGEARAVVVVAKRRRRQGVHGGLDDESLALSSPLFSSQWRFLFLTVGEREGRRIRSLTCHVATSHATWDRGSVKERNFHQIAPVLKVFFSFLIIENNKYISLSFGRISTLSIELVLYFKISLSF